MAEQAGDTFAKLMIADLERRTGFKYLASPYTHPDPLVREHRFMAAQACLHHLLQNRIWTYSPIVHCHELSKIWKMPHDAAYWLEYDTAMIRACSGIFVLMLPGWAQSVGVIGEIKLAAELGKSITYLAGRDFNVEAVIEGHRDSGPTTQGVRASPIAGSGPVDR